MKALLMLLLITFCHLRQVEKEFPQSPRPWQEAYNISLKHISFSHPMTVVNKSEHAEVLKRIAEKTEPQYSAYLNLLKVAEEQLAFIPNPPTTMNIMGGYEKNSNLSEMRAILWQNSHAAYSTALAYSYSGDQKYAVKAKNILMKWAKTSTTFSGADRGLQLGSFFNPMLYAADLLRG